MPELSPDLSGMAAQLLLPLFLHFGMVVGLYAALTWARLVAVRRGEASKNDFARADGDPPLSARIQAIWPTSSRPRCSPGSRRWSWSSPIGRRSGISPPPGSF